MFLLRALSGAGAFSADANDTLMSSGIVGPARMPAHEGAVNLKRVLNQKRVRWTRKATHPRARLQKARSNLRKGQHIVTYRTNGPLPRG